MMSPIDLIGTLSGIEHPGKFIQTGYPLSPLKYLKKKQSTRSLRPTLLMENLLVIGLPWGCSEVWGSNVRRAPPVVCHLSALTETVAVPGLVVLCSSHTCSMVNFGELWTLCLWTFSLSTPATHFLLSLAISPKHCYQTLSRSLLPLIFRSPI